MTNPVAPVTSKVMLRASALGGMMRVPVPRDLDSLAHPHLRMPEDVLEETRQPGDARRMADHARMQPDRHHLWLLGAFAIEPVESVAVPPLVVGARGEGTRRVLRVVVGMRIGQRQVVLAAHVDPV